MNPSKNMEIPEKTRHDGLPKSWEESVLAQVRSPHNSSTGPTATSGKRRRGRPPLSRHENVDVPILERLYNNIQQSVEASEEGEQKFSPRTPQRSSKNEEMMMTGDRAENVGVSEKRKRGRPPLSKGGTVLKKERREDAEVLVKRGRGRPQGSTKKFLVRWRRELRNDPEMLRERADGAAQLHPFSMREAQKKGRGRPRKTELLLLDQNSHVPQLKILTMKVRKTNEDTPLRVNEKTRLKEETRAGMKEKKRGRPRKYQFDIVQNGEQMPPEGHCLSVEEAMDEDSLPQTNAQTSQDPEMKKNPTRTQGVVRSQDTNAVTQSVLEHSSSAHPQRTEQLHFQQALLKELSKFRSQVTEELATTRVNVQEGAELVRSAIAGVSAQIHQLGLILQSLVNVFSSTDLFSQQSSCAHVTSLLSPRQDLPPGGATDAPQPPTQPADTSTNLNGETSSFHVPSPETQVESSPKSLP